MEDDSKSYYAVRHVEFVGGMTVICHKYLFKRLHVISDLFAAIRSLHVLLHGFHNMKLAHSTQHRSDFHDDGEERFN